jgi:hypothetical protein
MLGVMNKQSKEDGGAYAQQRHSKRERQYKNTREGCLAQQETDGEHETSNHLQSRLEQHEWENKIGCKP